MEDAPRSARDELRAWLIAIAMLACVFLVGGVLLAVLAAGAQEEPAGAALPAGMFAARAAATEAGLLVPAVFVLARRKQRPRWRVAAGDLSICAGALLAMLATNGAGSWLMARIGEAYEGFPSLTGGRWAVAAAFGCAIVVAPIAEELFFREALLCGVFARSARPYALAVTALLFGGMHAGAGGAVLFVSLSILGALLGWVRLETGSVGAAIAVHALHNALAWSFASVFPGSS